MVKINTQYLQKDTVEQVTSLFQQSEGLPSVQLQQFIDAPSFGLVQKEITKLKYESRKDPLLHSFGQAAVPIPLFDFVNSKEFIALVKMISDTMTSRPSVALLSFGWKDYILINDKAVPKPGVDVILDFTPHWHQDWGGHVVYSPGTGEAASIPVQPNTLTIVRRDKGMNRFVQYVNHRAGKHARYLLMMSF